VLYQLSYVGSQTKTRAGNGTRTRDKRLGRPLLYQLSYSRFNGQGRIRTSEGLPQRVYSPPHLTTLVPAHISCNGSTGFGLIHFEHFNQTCQYIKKNRPITYAISAKKASERIRTPDPLITNQLLYQLSYAGTIVNQDVLEYF
jgi:hypothetical protein